MQSLQLLLHRFFKEEDGATMVEYIFLVSLIGVISISAMRFLGSTAGNKLNKVSSNIANSN